MNQSQKIRTDRIDKIDFEKVANAMRDHLGSYLIGIGEDTDWTLVGFSIGGSALTDDFEPGKSDLDAHLIVNKCLNEQEKGFWHYMNNSSCVRTVNQELPEEFSRFDFIGFKTLDQNLEHHGNESILIKADEEYFKKYLPTKDKQSDLTQF